MTVRSGYLAWRRAHCARRLYRVTRGSFAHEGDHLPITEVSLPRSSRRRLAAIRDPGIADNRTRWTGNTSRTRNRRVPRRGAVARRDRAGREAPKSCGGSRVRRGSPG